MDNLRFGDILENQDTIMGRIIKGLSSVEHTNREGRLYASDAGWCERQAVLNSQKEFPSVISASTKVYFRLGEAIETIITDSLFEQGMLLFAQYKLPDVGINLGGYIDAIVHVNGHIRLLEVKSCGDLPTQPKGPHFSQTAIYSAITGLPASLLYFSRKVAGWDGKLMMRQFDLQRDQESLRSTLFRAVYAYHCNVAGVTPDKPAHLTSESQCCFCSFKGICWGDEKLVSPPPVTHKQHAELVKLSLKMVDDLMNPDNVKKRRNGVLSHIEKNGNKNATELLSGKTWASLIED